MLVTTERPKLWATARRSWASLFAALRRMALLFLIGFVLLAGVNIALDRVPLLWSIPTRDAMKATLTAGRSLHSADLAKAIGLDLAGAILKALIAAPIAVAMHRFILLDETRRFYFLSRLTLRFAAWILALQAPALILWWLILFATPATGLVPVLTILLIACAMVLLQTLPLFPAVAVEEKSPDLSARLETALARSEHMFWRTLIILFLTFLPVGLAQAIAVRAFAKLTARITLLAPLAKAAASVILIALTAAVISWLFSYAAQRATGAEKAGTGPAPAKA